MKRKKSLKTAYQKLHSFQIPLVSAWDSANGIFNISFVYNPGAMDFFHKEVVQSVNTLATSDTFPARERYLMPVNACHELPSFLRNKKDALVHCLHILDAASSNIKANWGLIINAHHVLLISFI